MGSRKLQLFSQLLRRGFASTLCIKVDHASSVFLRKVSHVSQSSTHQFPKTEGNGLDRRKMSETNIGSGKQILDQGTSMPFGPVVMKLDSPEFHSLFTPGLHMVKNLFDSYGFEFCIAGGAVRDLILGIKPNDVDFATTATPDEMNEVFRSRSIRLINEGGNSHGTVTCRIHEENFEITTLRIDKITDGRHAQVEFTKDWYQDASRRDLTINSMFLDLDGNVIDFFDGKQDLLNHIVRFVGDPRTRITEDYLRILRFFRFFGRIAGDEADFDPRAIAAIKEGAGGLDQISGPRIWTEMTKILEGQHMAKIVRKMHECDLFPHIGFPQIVDLDRFEEIYDNTRHLNTNHMTYASALLRNEDDVLNLEQRVMFSRNERKISLFIVNYRNKITKYYGSERLKFCQDILVDAPPHEGNHILYLLEVLKYIGDFVTITQLKEWKMPKFPITGRMILEAGTPKGKTVGLVRNELKHIWKESNYLLSAKELLVDVPKILDSLKHGSM